jgi:cell division septation protein DedD
LLADVLANKLKRVGSTDPVRSDPRFEKLRDALGVAAPVMAPVASVKGKPAKGAQIAPLDLLPVNLVSPAPALTLAAAPQVINANFVVAPPAPAPDAEAAPKPAPPPAPTTFAVVLGTFDDAVLAASVWRELAAADPLAVKGLTPRIVAKKGAAATLVAGPLEDKDTAAGRCTAFAALGMQCVPGAYGGKALPGA